MVEVRTVLRLAAAIITTAVGSISALPATVAAETILLGATSTTANSGLLDHLLPRFKETSGIDVRVVVQGTGAILRSAADGNFDAVLVHDPGAEQAFMATGFGESRRPVMVSHFLLVGPSGDPAAVAGAQNVSEALSLIAGAQALFVSRGDNSGTHAKELTLWDLTDLDPRAASGTWYRETGAGMGATLNIAAALDGYTLTESASWASFGNRDRLVELVGNETPPLLNPYSIIVIDPSRHPHTRIQAARALAVWLTGDEGQAEIASFRIGSDQPFRPVGVVSN